MSFAARVIARLQADLAFQLGAPPPAAALGQVSSVLWRKVTDSRAIVKLEILCVVDRELYPQYVFPLTLPQVVGVGQQCQALAGKSMLGLVDNHLRITVIEISGFPLGSADHARLAGLRLGGTGAVFVDAIHVDVAARSCWAASRAGSTVMGIAAALAGADGLLDGMFDWTQWLDDVLRGRPQEPGVLRKR